MKESLIRLSTSSSVPSMATVLASSGSWLRVLARISAHPDAHSASGTAVRKSLLMSTSGAAGVLPAAIQTRDQRRLHAGQPEIFIPPFRKGSDRLQVFQDPLRDDD